MASYVFGSIGTALGGPIGGIVGTLIGGLVDQQITRMLTPNQTTTNRGPRLTELSVTGSTEGAMLPKVYGRTRFGGQVIWCTEFQENEVTSSETTGGKGGGRVTVNDVTYTYSLSFAVAFCEGNGMAHLGRVWLDSKEADLSKYTFRFHSGSETQAPDPLIQAKEGIERTPAFRGVTYIVFEDLPLAEFGNRMPQVTAEVVVPLETDDPDDLSNIGRAWQLIPASGENIYGTQIYTRVHNMGTDEEERVIENMHNNFNEADAVVAMDILDHVQPNLEAVSIVVSWFGTDLRAGECRVIPKVEGYHRNIVPNEWEVAGYTRETAELVSYDDKGNPIYGGTPSDHTVIELIQLLKSKGQRVVFYPFILMDVPPDNTLPNPYSDNAAETGQAVFPWRGRITCSPAAGYAGSPDKTGTAGSQVDAFFNRTEGYRQMVLHYAHLCQAAGGIDSFIIGSELVGLTTVRSGPGAGPYPAVDELKALAAEVRAILGPGTRISYAADWSEYHSHRPADGTNDVIFNMDPLWADSNIDFIGIDNYLPLTDWRDGSAHLDYDAVNGPVTIYDREYLRSGMEGGEYYDWYYASANDRRDQVRTPIQDLGHGEHWIYRQKDIRNWWANAHHNRPGGSRAGSPTSWALQSKPIWFTEFGCPAIDKGPNQPNVFYDPKSSESFFPYFSSGQRDDFIERLYLEVSLAYWRDNSPISSVYSGPMIELENMFIWTWDTRPFPAFPVRTDVWSDGPQWVLGHWVTGRIDGAVLARLVARLCKEAGLDENLQVDVEGLYGPNGLVRGLVLSSSMSQRDALAALAQAYHFKALESEGKLKFVMDINAKSMELPLDDLVLKEGQTAPVTITRGQETDLPNIVRVSFLDELNSYQPAAISAQKGTGSASGAVASDFPLVWTTEQARAHATMALFEYWAARENGSLTLPPSYAALDVGDAAYVPVGGRGLPVQIHGIDDNIARDVEFVGFDVSLTVSPTFQADIRLPRADHIRPVASSVVLAFMNLPLASDDEPLQHSMRLAASAAEGAWPGGVSLFRDDGSGGFMPVQTITARSAVGTLGSPLHSGPSGRWDRVNEVYINMLSGGLSSVSEAQLLLSSGNTLGVQNAATGEWEVLQFATATLTSPGTYRLTNLLRGLLGTEHVMDPATPYPEGSRVVVLSPSTVMGLNVPDHVAANPTAYRWGPASYPASDPRFIEASRTGTRAGLRPYSPCDLLALREASTNNLELTWKRRTRLNGDSWDQAEVPLNEEIERYTLEVYNLAGSVLLRTEVLTSPSYTYTAANQIADHGALVSDFYLRIYQYGTLYGANGPPLEGVFYVKGAF